MTSHPDPPAREDGTEPEEVLRAKYLDYCSAQVAEILLLLSPDEMYVLAQDAAQDSGLAGDLGVGGEHDGTAVGSARDCQSLPGG